MLRIRPVSMGNESSPYKGRACCLHSKGRCCKITKRYDLELENLNAVMQKNSESGNCRNLLKKAGSMVDIVVLPDDPTYQVAQLKDGLPTD
jgi:hypothetical protein